MKEITERFEHFTEVRLGIEKPSAMPNATLNALTKIMGSPIDLSVCVLLVSTRLLSPYCPKSAF